jgi:hypothetical protein
MEALLFLIVVGGCWAKFVWDTNPEVRVIFRKKGSK